MPRDMLHAEAIASTLLLSTPAWHAKPLFDPRPGLLAAHLSADQQWRASCNLREWRREYQRVLALVGWRHSLQERNAPARAGRSPRLLHQHLARGLAALCNPRWAPVITRTLAAIAATERESAALKVFMSHGWQLRQVNLQVALVEEDGTLLTFGVSGSAGSGGPQQSLMQPVSTAACGFHMASAVAALDTEHYGKALAALEAKLGEKLNSAIAPFQPGLGV